MTNDQNDKILEHIAKEITEIRKSQVAQHGRIAVIEQHVSDTKPIIQDYQRTKNRGLGFMAGVSSVAGIVGASVTWIGAKFGLTP